MSNEDDAQNWYLRSLQNIADSIGQARMTKSASLKKAISESFDISISTDQAKDMMKLMSENYKSKDRVSYMSSKLVEILKIEESDCRKIASFLSNFKK